MPTIDCDVHCAVPSRAALAPYLDPHWRQYLEIGNFKEPAAVRMTYPAWLDDMHRHSTHSSLESFEADVFGNASLAIVQCYYGLESFTHPYFADAIANAVNEWLQREWLDRDSRLLASAVVTPQNPEAAVAQIERIADDARFVQILVPARSIPGYGNQRFWPIWRAAAEAGLAVGITFGGSTGLPSNPVGWMSGFFEEYAVAILTFQAQLMSLVTSGIFEECPDLRVVVMESGWTWLPAWCWRMDQEWRAFQREVPWMRDTPSSYIARHFRFVTNPVDAPPSAQQLRDVLQQIPAGELLMFGSDYPHSFGPDATGSLLEELSQPDRERVLWSNAAELYGLERRQTAAAAIAQPA
jgi:predicted TIM-barrel fold metal-dependent hydrolase